MTVITPVNKETIPYVTVLLTSLGINCTEHIDVFLDHSALSEEDISLIRSSIAEYNITLYSEVYNDDNALFLTYDMIINKPLIEKSLSSQNEIPIISAWNAHSSGMTYQEIKEFATIIQYDCSKPWGNSNFHYDIEKIWWEYAKKTPFYDALLKFFIRTAFEDSSVEDFIRELIAETTAQKKQLNDIMNKFRATYK